MKDIKEVIKMIKKDCIMYIEKLNKCNALNQLDCSKCSFYDNKNKEKYIKNMKDRDLYFGYKYTRCSLSHSERESLR